jgi:SAGA-associated factor 29
MSRNRPRPRDNGFGNNEELELWTKICQDIRKSKDKFDQQTTLSLQIKALVDKITNDGNSEYILNPPRLIPRSIPHQAPISAP